MQRRRGLAELGALRQPFSLLRVPCRHDVGGLVEARRERHGCDPISSSERAAGTKPCGQADDEEAYSKLPATDGG